MLLQLVDQSIVQDGVATMINRELAEPYDISQIQARTAMISFNCWMCGRHRMKDHVTCTPRTRLTVVQDDIDTISPALFGQLLNPGGRDQSRAPRIISRPVCMSNRL